MKNAKCLSTLLLILTLFLISCIKEGDVSAPAVADVEMYMTDVNGKDSVITDVFSGNTIKILVRTDADMVSIWPSGVRIVMKKANSAADSIDMFNHPVLVTSDSYVDYGLVKAQGLTTTLTEGGWYAFYTYPATGEYECTVLATNHGYHGPDYKRTVHQVGKVTVK